MPVDTILTQATTEHESHAADTLSLTSRGSSHHSADTFDSFSDGAPEGSSSRIHQSANHSSAHSGVSNHSSQADNLSSQDSALSTVIVIYDYKVSLWSSVPTV